MRSVAIVPVLALSLWITVPASAAITSTFDTGTEGWLAADLPGSGNYAAPTSTFAPTWIPTGGAPGGFINAADPSTGAYFFQAPAAYLGNQSANLGGTLSFQITTSHNNWQDDRIVVLVGDGGKVIVAPIAQPPVVDTWLAYSVPLTAASFLKNNPQGAAATDADLAAILTNLEALYIPAEFATPVIETTGLDSVTLTPEPTSILLLGGGAVLALARRKHPRTSSRIST